MLLTLRSLLEDGSAATIGNGAAVLPSMVASGAGSVVCDGSGAAALSTINASGIGTTVAVGSAAASLPAVTAAGSGGEQASEPPVQTGAGWFAGLMARLRPAARATPHVTVGRGAAMLPAMTAKGFGVGSVKAPAADSSDEITDDELLLLLAA